MTHGDPSETRLADVARYVSNWMRRLVSDVSSRDLRDAAGYARERARAIGQGETGDLAHRAAEMERLMVLVAAREAVGGEEPAPEGEGGGDRA